MMMGQSEPETTEAPSFEADPVLQPVLASRALSRSPLLRKLLMFLWEHRGEEISEYAIALEALGRREGFDPSTDATVRVTIARLRQKLRDFYLEEGKDCSPQLEIPLGTHALTAVERRRDTLVTDPLIAPNRIVDLPDFVSSVGAEIPEPRRFFSARILIYGCIAAVITLVALGWFLSNRSFVPRATRTADQTLIGTSPWDVLLKNGRPLRVIVPTPIFFSWKESSANATSKNVLQVRDVSVNDFEDISKSPELANFNARYGKPTLGQAYTVISDTFASIAITRFLDKTGLGDRVEVLDRGSVTLSTLENDNVVALGTSSTLSPFATYLDEMRFNLLPREETVVNRRPWKNDPTAINVRYESEQRSKWPGIIAVLPGSTSNSVCVLLISRHTSALATFITSKEGLAQLAEMRKKAGSPVFFEMVIESEMDGDHLVGQKPLFFYPWEPPSQL